MRTVAMRRHLIRAAITDVDELRRQAAGRVPPMRGAVSAGSSKSNTTRAPSHVSVLHRRVSCGDNTLCLRTLAWDSIAATSMALAHRSDERITGSCGPPPDAETVCDTADALAATMPLLSCGAGVVAMCGGVETACVVQSSTA